jgi:hypothetical protein
MHRLAAVSRHLKATNTSTNTASSSSSDQPLVPDDAETQYSEQGYFVVRRLLPADAVRRVRAEVGHILSGHAHGNSDGYVRDYTRTDGRGGAPGTPGELSGPASVRVVRDPRCQSSVLWDNWLTHPNVHALQRRMLGEDVRVMGTSFFTKAADGFGEATPLHQDLFLWSQPGPQASTRPAKREHLSTWVALDRVDRGNGCLHMIPRSHSAGVTPHKVYPDSVHAEIRRDLQVATCAAEAIELDPGDAVCWAPAMWHMSPPNVSNRHRWGGVMVSFPDRWAEAARQTDRPFLIRNGERCQWPGGSS